MINFIKKFIKSYIRNKQFMTGLSHILKIRQNYNNIQMLSDVDFRIFSQNGEDGILDYLLYQINIEKPKFLEIGVGNYSEANTKFIFDRVSSKGFIIDFINDFESEVKKNTKYWKGDLTIINEKVDSINISRILEHHTILKDLDLFSLDIDGIDYWILNEMPKDFSKIVVLEYNPTFGNKFDITVPNLKDFNRKDYHYSHLCYGMSVQAAINLMKKKNFYFIGVNLMRNNAFFVSNKYPKEKFFKNLNIPKINTIDNSNFRESRDKTGKLNYLTGNNKIQKIADCEVINLKDGKNVKIKISNLLNENSI